MGIIIEKASILCSTFTVIALLMGVNPLYAFLIGGIGLFAPLRILLGGKILSQTGVMASLGSLTAFNFFGYSWLNAWLIGAAAGYFYLYWWLFFYPRIFK